MSGVVLLVLRILSAAALYAFLGWALYLLWQTLRIKTLEVASRQVIPLGLRIRTPGEDEVQRNFTEGEIAIGRDPDCECVLNHGTVSARHARLSFHHRQWWIHDLQSTNGTALNDEPLKIPTIIVNEDTIRCGQVLLTVVIQNQKQFDAGE